jgi:hypothetical protein
VSDHFPNIGDPISWKAGYVAASRPYIIALPPNFITTKTRNGRTILKPRVPTKFTNKIGTSEACFTRLAIIDVCTQFHLKINDIIRLLIGNIYPEIFL